MISAIARKDRAIGKNNALLWHIPEDFQHFKTLTSGHAVIMGENTYKSIGKSLPNRTNIVMTLSPDFAPADCVVVRSINEALEKARAMEKDEVFICGGASIYKQMISYADRLYLTLVEGDFDADTFFPDYSDFTKVLSKEKVNNGKFEFAFVILERE